MSAFLAAQSKAIVIFSGSLPTAPKLGLMELRSNFDLYSWKLEDNGYRKIRSNQV